MQRYLTNHLRYVWQMANGFRVRHEQWLAHLRERDVSAYLPTDRPWQVLDLANGRLRPQYMIMRAAGHHVYGVDLVNQPQWSTTDIAYRVARQIYATTALLPPAATTTRNLLCGNVNVLPFAANTFDLVTSVAAFEHFLNVPAVVAEMDRVLRPGGIGWIVVHLFSSPSGGHNVKLTEIPLRTLPPGVEPWDHLRQRRLPFHVPLNEWRRDQFLAAFSQRFEVLKEYCAVREGEHWLTPALSAELSAYSSDELTCMALAVLLRKPASP